MFERFTDDARKVVVLAQEEARSHKHNFVGAEHVLLAIIQQKDGIGAKAIANTDIGDIASVRDVLLQKHPVGTEEVSGHAPFTQGAKKALELSLREALSLGHNFIDTGHLLLGLIREEEGVEEIFDAFSIDGEQLKQDVILLMQEDSATGSSSRRTRNSSGEETKKTPAILEQFGRNLTQEAADGKLDPVIGREREIARIEQILSRRRKSNPVLIGEPGVGKTAVVEGLAQRIASGDVTAALRGKAIWTIDIGAMVAGSRYRGDFEERLTQFLKAVMEDGNIIIFFDEIHTLVGAGNAEGSVDASSIFKPPLARGEVQVIGATTITEYRKYFEKDSALERRFLPINLDEPSIEDTIIILDGVRLGYEEHHQVRYTDEAIAAAAKLAHRYIPERFMPDKAIDLLDEAGAYVKTHRVGYHPDLEENDRDYLELLSQQRKAALQKDWDLASDLQEKIEANIETRQGIQRKLESEGITLETVVEVSHVAHVLSLWKGIPAEQFTEEEAERLLHMEDTLHKRVIGQHDAILAIAKSIRRSRSGLKDPKRPTGSFMFLGPTGVGKTELAKALAAFLFGTEEDMITLDMSEYMEKHTVSRLIGAPPGYIGYSEGGQLTEAVRRKPFSVVLLDEIEKAHPDVSNILLQVLEDGRLTDGQGRVVDFKNVVIIMTGNVGSDRLKQRSIGFSTEEPEQDYERMKELVLMATKDTFRPEFINRVDEVIVFHQLTMDEIIQIVDLEIAKLEKLLTENPGDMNNIALTDEARTALAKWGYSEEFGARPVKRAIQRRLTDPLSEKILFGELEGAVTVLVEYDADEEKLTFHGINDEIEDFIEDVQSGFESDDDTSSDDEDPEA